MASTIEQRLLHVQSVVPRRCSSALHLVLPAIVSVWPAVVNFVRVGQAKLFTSRSRLCIYVDRRSMYDRALKSALSSVGRSVRRTCLAQHHRAKCFTLTNNYAFLADDEIIISRCESSSAQGEVYFFASTAATCLNCGAFFGSAHLLCQEMNDPN